MTDRQAFDVAIPSRRHVLVAGATGVIGRRLVPLLLQRGYAVTGLTRSPERARGLDAMGATGRVVDVADGAALIDVVTALRPDVVIHQVTDLATPTGQPIGELELARTARIRDEGTAHLVAAARAAGATRFVAQSLAGLYAHGPEPHSEADPLMPAEQDGSATLRGIVALERIVMSARDLEGVILRYGWLYGPGTGLADAWSPPGVHVDAAAWAAALAVESGRPGVYNIADEDGPVSVHAARVELGWAPGLRLDLADPPSGPKTTAGASVRSPTAAPSVAPGQVYGPGAGSHVWWFLGSRMSLKAGSVDTHGSFTLLEQYMPAGFAPPPHVHVDEEEVFAIFEGTLRVVCGTSTWDVGPGDTVVLPRGVPHGFTVTGDRPARVWHLTAPAKFERFVAEVGEPAATDGLPPVATIDLDATVRRAAAYGYEILDPGG